MKKLLTRSWSPMIKEEFFVVIQLNWLKILCNKRKFQIFSMMKDKLISQNCIPEFRKDRKSRIWKPCGCIVNLTVDLPYLGNFDIHQWFMGRTGNPVVVSAIHKLIYSTWVILSATSGF